MPKELKLKSHDLLVGPGRAPARAMLKAVGFTDEDLSRPIIGVANTWIEVMPCNFHLRRLSERVKAGIRAAGGTPIEYNTIAVSDGISMGTEGMKASLISREVIADSIELVARGHLFDAVVALSGCDKTIPGTVMALAAPEPAVADALRRLDHAGPIPGTRRHDSRRLRSGRQTCVRQDDQCRIERSRRSRLSRPRRLRRAVHRQYHGHRVRIPRHLADGTERCSGHGPAEGRRRLRMRQDGHGPA